MRLVWRFVGEPIFYGAAGLRSPILWVAVAAIAGVIAISRLTNPALPVAAVSLFGHGAAFLLATLYRSTDRNRIAGRAARSLVGRVPRLPLRLLICVTLYLVCLALVMGQNWQLLPIVACGVMEVVFFLALAASMGDLVEDQQPDPVERLRHVAIAAPALLVVVLLRGPMEYGLWRLAPGLYLSSLLQVGFGLLGGATYSRVSEQLIDRL